MFSVRTVINDPGSEGEIKLRSLCKYFVIHLPQGGLDAGFTRTNDGTNQRAAGC